MKRLFILLLLCSNLLAGGALKQSTATTINLGPFVDSTITPLTAIDVTTMTVRLVKQSDTSSTTNTSYAPTASGGSNDCVHVTTGMYNCELTSTNTDTIGRLNVVVTTPGALVVFDTFEVRGAAAYNFSPTGLGAVLVDDAITAAKIAAGAITSSEAPNLDAAISTRLAPTVAGRTLDVTTTGEAGIDWANIGNPTSTVNLSNTTVGILTTNSDKTGYRLSVTGVDDVWNATLSGHTTAGTFGRAAQVLRDGTAQAGAATTITLDSGASSTNSFYNNTLLQIVAGTGAGQSRIISSYVGSTKVATVGTWTVNPDNTSVFVIRSFDAIPGASAPTAAQVADAVWEEAVVDHSGTAGSTAEKLAAAGAAGDPWATTIPGAYGAGTAGKIVGDNLNATITSRLSPTVAGRTLDITATGAAGIDLGNVENQSTTLTLSGTTVKDTTDVNTKVTDLQSRTPTALVGGKMDANIGTISNSAITAASINADAFTAAKFAADVSAEFAATLMVTPYEGTETFKNFLRYGSSALFGKYSLAGATFSFRDLADTKDRLVYTTTTTARTNVARDPTD